MRGVDRHLWNPISRPRARFAGTTVSAAFNDDKCVSGGDCAARAMFVEAEIARSPLLSCGRAPASRRPRSLAFCVSPARVSPNVS